MAGGFVQAGDDADFRPVKPGAGRGVGEARLAPHRRFQGGDGVAERASVVAHDGDRQLPLAALVDVPCADVRNIGQTPGDFAFDLLLR